MNIYGSGAFIFSAQERLTTALSNINPLVSSLTVQEHLDYPWKACILCSRSYGFEFLTNKLHKNLNLFLLYLV